MLQSRFRYKSGIQIPFRLNSSESLRNLRLIRACVSEGPYRPVAPVLLRARRLQNRSAHMDVLTIALHDFALLDKARNLRLNLISSFEHPSHVSLTWFVSNSMTVKPASTESAPPAVRLLRPFAAGARTCPRSFGRPI